MQGLSLNLPTPKSQAGTLNVIISFCVECSTTHSSKKTTKRDGWMDGRKGGGKGRWVGDSEYGREERREVEKKEGGEGGRKGNILPDLVS